MDNKTSSKPSTIFPGGRGAKGKRAPYTHFFTSEIQAPEYKQITIITDYGVEYKFANRFLKDVNDSSSGIDPITGDFVIYFNDSKAHLFYIYDKQGTKYNVREIDTWELDTDVSVKRESLELTVAFMKNTVMVDILNENRLSPTTNTAYTLNAEVLTNTKAINNNILFNVTSMNLYQLSYYKVYLRFFTQAGYSSPAFDSIIPKMFIKRNIELVNEGMGVTRTFSDDYKSPRGYLYNYDRKNPEVQNFDREKMDNFVMIIKDFDEAVGVQSYTSSFELPIQALDKIGIENYKCYAYVQIQNSNETRSDILLGEVDLSSLLE